MNNNNNNMKLVVLIFIIMNCMMNGVQSDYLEQRKVIYLDHSSSSSSSAAAAPQSYLFRGNEPKIKAANNSDVFAYDLLVTYLKNATITQAGFSLPDFFYLIIIKYVYDASDPVEKGDITIENTFFTANPTLGEFSYKLIWGDADDPSFAKVEAMAKNLSAWQHDNLPVYIPYLNNLLNTPRTQPTVIYFHCECGCDRTGEIGGAYAMKYLDKSYANATKWNHDIAGRPILPNHQFALHWYCYYRTLVEGASFTC